MVEADRSRRTTSRFAGTPTGMTRQAAHALAQTSPTAPLSVLPFCVRGLTDDQATAAVGFVGGAATSDPDRKAVMLGWVSREAAWSFPWSFPPAVTRPARNAPMDDPADVSSENGSGQHLLDTCVSTRNRKVAGSNPTSGST